MVWTKSKGWDSAGHGQYRNKERCSQNARQEPAWGGLAPCQGVWTLLFGRKRRSHGKTEMTKLVLCFRTIAISKRSWSTWEIGNHYNSPGEGCHGLNQVRSSEIKRTWVCSQPVLLADNLWGLRERKKMKMTVWEATRLERSESVIQAGKGTGRVWESEEVKYETLNLESKALAFTSLCTSSVSYSTSLNLSFLNCQMCVHMGGGRRGVTSCLGALSTVMTL